MRVSFHRRRHDSLPPRKRRSWRVLAVAIVLTTCTMAFAASRLTHDDPPAVNAAERDTRDVVDARIHAHLRRLER